MDVNVDLTNNPEGHRGRVAAQAALTAQRNGNTKEANRILSEMLSESFTDINGALVGGYCQYTTTVLSGMLQIMEEDYGVDTEALLQHLFLTMESD